MGKIHSAGDGTVAAAGSPAQPFHRCLLCAALTTPALFIGLRVCKFIMYVRCYLFLA